MKDGVMKTFMDILGESSKWGQSSNTNFMDYLMTENRHLKTELQSFKTEARKRQEELSVEVARLKVKNKELEENIMRSAISTLRTNNTYPSTNSSSVTPPVNGIAPYIPTSIDQMRTTSAVTTNVNSGTNSNSVTSAGIASYIPTPIDQMRTTSAVTTNVNSGTNSNSVTSVGIAPYIPTSIDQMRTISAVTTNINSGTNSNSVTSAGIEPYIPTPIDQMRRTTSIVTTDVNPGTNSNSITFAASGDIIPSAINISEEQMNTNVNSQDIQRPFIVTPLNIAHFKMPLLKRRKDKHTKRSPISTPMRTKRTIYAPSFYDGMVVNISDDER